VRNAHLPAPQPDRVACSLRCAPLRALYAAWSAKRRSAGLPQAENLDLDSLPAAEDLALAEAEPGTNPPCFRLVRVGRGLEQRAGRPLLGERIGGSAADAALDPLGGAAWAYRHALASGAPSYEFAYFNFGEETPQLFERLLLPVGRGSHPTHLIVASLFSDPP
jgi:hypothetical protein